MVMAGLVSLSCIYSRRTRAGGALSRIVPALACIALFCVPLEWAFGQPVMPETPPSAGTPAPAAEPPAPSIEDTQKELNQKIDALDTRIQTAEGNATEEQAKQLGLTLSALQDQVLNLRQLRSVYEDHLAALEDLKEVRQLQADLDRETSEYQGPTEPPPYTPWYVDTFRDAVTAKEHQKDLEEHAIELAKSQLDRTQKDLAKAQAALARAKSDATANSDPAAQQGMEWKVQAANDALKLLQATVPLNELQVRVAQEKVALRDGQLKLLKKKLEDAEARERYRSEDLDARKQEIAKSREDLQKKLKEAIAQKDTDQSKLANARESLQSMSGEQATAQQATIELLKAKADASSDKVMVIREQLDSLFREEDIWTTRYALHQGAADFSLPDELKDAENYAETLDSLQQARIARVEVIRASLSEWDRKLANAQGDSTDPALVRDMLKTLNDHLDTLRTSLTNLSTMEQVNQHLIDDLTTAQHHLTFKQRWELYSKTALNIWDYPLPFSMGGEKLTVHQIVLAGIILVFGFIFTRFIRRYLRRAVFSRTRMDLNAAANLERLIHYFLLIFVVLFAMRIVNIPLTAFTIFGGALAIGVGFGAQNLINNFISGLILMLERPIRIGDLVEIDDRAGYIEEIGARCSRLRMFSGVDVLVPNSVFLEKNVINWTLSDAKVRYTVTVGVAYGSPTRQVAKLIMKAVTEHGRVLEDPEPVVVFSDFGESALMFEVYFWLTMGPATDPRVVRSDIRHRIDGLFREAGIVIAFPQRDLHLDTAAPLDVRIVAKEVKDNAPSPETGEDEEAE